MIGRAAAPPRTGNARPARGCAGWPGSCSPSGAGAPKPRHLPSVLVLAPPGEESDELFADLSRREDLCLLRVATGAAATMAVREMAVALVIVCPEVPGAAVDALLPDLEAARPGTPVLAVRARRAQEPAGWRARGVGVLRMPLLPGVLSRSVDVVLGMKRPAP